MRVSVGERGVAKMNEGKSLYLAALHYALNILSQLVIFSFVKLFLKPQRRFTCFVAV